MEIWKDIKEYEGLYQVSNKGKIRSLPKMIGNRFRDNSIILKSWKNKSGYLTIALSKNDIKSTKKIHILVANAFLIKHFDFLTVNHKDCNKTNNNVENLEWITLQDNLKHARINNLFKYSRGKDNVNSKSILQFDLNNNFLNEFSCAKEIERIYNFNQSNISKCCLNKRKSAYNFIWKFKN